MFDAMLKLACEEALDREYAEAKAYAEANPVIPSEEFHKRMAKLIHGRTDIAVKTEQPRGRRIMRVSKRIAIVLMILCTISFVTLMCSAAVRDAAYKMTSQIFSVFLTENPGVSPYGDEFMDYQTDKQIEQLESIISDTLSTVGLPQDTSFQIHVDGWHNVIISGIDEADAAKIKLYVEPMGIVLSSAYASKNKSQLYYVQSAIWSNEQLNDEDSLEYFEVIREYRQIIREYMFANNITSTDEIMAQTRNISYVGGKLVFEVK